MELATVVMETPLGDVTISGGYELVMEVQARCNAHDALAKACKAQQAAIEAILQALDDYEMLAALDRTLYQGAQEQARAALGLVGKAAP